MLCGEWIFRNGIFARLLAVNSLVARLAHEIYLQTIGLSQFRLIFLQVLEENSFSNSVNSNLQSGSIEIATLNESFHS